MESAVFWGKEVFLFFPTDPSLHSLFSPILWLLFSPVGVCVPPQHLGCVPPRSHGIAALRSTQVIYSMTPRLKSGALCWSSLLWLDPGERGDGDGFTWSLLAADVALYAALKHGKNFKCLPFELHTHGWNWKICLIFFWEWFECEGFCDQHFFCRFNIKSSCLFAFCILKDSYLPEHLLVKI